MAKEKKTSQEKTAPAPEQQTAVNEETENKTAENEAPQGDNADVKENEDADTIKKLTGELEATKDKFLRTAAEYDNFRRRSQKEKESIYNDSKADTVSKLVPVMDNFERAAAAQGSPEDYKKGMEMIVKQFSDALAALGVESFGEAGEAFDPNIHNGVSHVDDENLGENTISAVYQKGYKIGDRIIRHAVVVVAN